MISDSPYKVGDQVMSAWAGILTGLAATLVMLLVVQLLQSVSHVRTSELLSQVGLLFLPQSSDPGAQRLAGFILHEMLGGLFGLLFALSLQRIPSRGVIGIGIFYGFVLWIIGSLLIGIFFGENLRQMMRSLAWLLASISYGCTLAIVSIVVSNRQTSQTVTVLD